MLKRTKRLLTARSTVLVLILLLTAAMTAAVIVKQTGVARPSTAGAGQAGPARPSGVLELLGLDRVFSTWWFVALAVVFVVSLLLSTWDQLQTARARMFHLPPEDAERGDVTCALPCEEVEQLLAREGYRRLAGGPGRSRYVKAWSGYWGQFLLHLGMSVTVVSSLVYVLTEHRVLLRAVSGSAVPIVPGNSMASRGLAASELPLPASVMLFRLEPAFRDDDGLKDLASDLVFTDARGASEDVRVGVNDQQSYRGLVVYQRTAAGNAFDLELTNGAEEPFAIQLQLPLPARRDAASYGNHTLPDARFLLKAKYYANADRSRIMPENPELFLRLYEGDRLLAETSLLRGQSGKLGPYDVRLAAVEWWTEILFEGTRGTPGIFTGFAVLLLGATLTFVAVPREAVLSRAAAGCALSWRATRFPELYREERDGILARCKGESRS